MKIMREIRETHAVDLTLPGMSAMFFLFKPASVEKAEAAMKLGLCRRRISLARFASLRFQAPSE